METRRLVLTLTGVAVALIVVIGILVVVTSGGGGSDSANNGGSSGTSSSALPQRVAGELRLFGGDPVTLDPACASDAESANYIVEVFSGLVSFDKDLKIVPDIAKSYDVSSDGRTYTFHLRTNVLFHDNSRRVTASDFKFSMERALNHKTQSTVGEVYLDDLAGAKDFANGKADSVSGIKVVDQDTLELTINAASDVFLEKLTYPTAYVVDQRQVRDATCFQGANWTRHPNGTGPFKLTEWVLGQRITLEPNKGYYLDPKPSLAKVTFVLAGGSALTMYQNDELDVSGVGFNDIEGIRDDPSNPLNKEYHEASALVVQYIGFNVNKKPFDDPRVRRALTMATDRDFLAKNFLRDLVIPATGILPPGMPGYNDKLQGIPFDAAGAKKLLDDAGGPDILNNITILTPGQGAAPTDVLDAILAMWTQNLGVNITVQQEEFATFLQDIDQSNFQTFSLGWIADYPDPQNFLEIKLRGDSPNNESKYSNPDFDRLLQQASTTTDQRQRLALYDQAEQLAVNDAPWIPLYFGKASYLVKPRVQGYFVPPFVIENLRYVSVTG